MNDTDENSSEIVEIRDVVQEITDELIGRPLDNVVSIDRNDESWIAGVEVVERRSIPDTQDILGRYEITLDESKSATGYRRTERYRRDDMGRHD